MSWTSFHSRGDTLRAVVEIVNTRRDGVLPMRLPGVPENFADELDLVGALLLKWHARLLGNIEQALLHQPMDLEHAAASAWSETARQLPGVLLVIDRCTDEPVDEPMARAMARSREREWIRLAYAAGLASAPGPLAVEAGRRVQETARAMIGSEPSAAPAAVEESAVQAPVPAQPQVAQPQVAHTLSAHRGESFVDRIRAALVA